MIVGTQSHAQSRVRGRRHQLPVALEDRQKRAQVLDGSHQEATALGKGARSSC